MGSATSSFTTCLCNSSVININGHHYYNQKQLAEGGFSYVNLIEERRSGKFRALKKIICHSSEDEQIALNEVKYCQKFRHANIIELIEHCVKSKGHLSEVWLVFPFYKRGTLYDEFQRLKAVDKRFEPEKIVKLIGGLCEGVKAFHDYSHFPLAHRDLKPANILLTDNDVPVIMDLGSVCPARVQIQNSKDARFLEDQASQRSTLPYRAPELFQVPYPSVIDEKVDIWSLGCIFFSLMFLVGPFDSVWLKNDSVALAVQNPIKFPDTNIYPVKFTEFVKKLLICQPEYRPNIHQVIEDYHCSLKSLS